MDTQQIIADIELVRDILSLDPSPARKAAAAALLRAAAGAIEEAATTPNEGPKLRLLQEGEEIEKGDVYMGLNSEYVPSGAIGKKYVTAHYLPHFRPIKH